jgi:UDP-glucose 4-epimerase
VDKIKEMLSFEPEYDDLETIISHTWQWLNRPK